MALSNGASLSADDFRRGFDRLRELEASKDTMINVCLLTSERCVRFSDHLQTLLDKLSGLEFDHKNANFDYDREREANRRLAAEKEDLSRELRSFRSMVVRKNAYDPSSESVCLMRYTRTVML